MIDRHELSNGIMGNSVRRRAPNGKELSEETSTHSLDSRYSIRVKQMETKSNLYPQATDAPPQYGDLGGPSMIPTETLASAPPAAIITVQQPQVYMQGGAQNYLGRVPTLATCPSCQARQLTTVNHEPSTKTHLLALLICLVGGICCCCIPYCVDSCQSATHTCSSCGAFIGTYQN